MPGDEARQAMVARYASARLSPVLARIGWATEVGEAPTVPVLRAELIETLGAMGDNKVVAEANRRLAGDDPLATGGPLRSTILAVAARNVDAAGWERLRAQARAERSPLVRDQLYKLLGTAARPGACPARARPRPDRRARRDDQRRDHLGSREGTSRPRLRLRLPQPREGRGPGRYLVALALPRRPRRRARPTRR